MSTNLFRAMKADGDGLPTCGSAARCLGVRIPIDIAVDDDGLVHPRTGGMSVTPNDPYLMPAWRKPPQFGGYGRDPVFAIRETDLGEQVAYLDDDANPGWHGFVEPCRTMRVENYQQALRDTRQNWRQQ